MITYKLMTNARLYITFLQENCGLTATDIAKKIGVARSSISRVKAGELPGTTLETKLYNLIRELAPQAVAPSKKPVTAPTNQQKSAAKVPPVIIGEPPTKPVPLRTAHLAFPRSSRYVSHLGHERHEL